MDGIEQGQGLLNIYDNLQPQLKQKLVKYTGNLVDSEGKTELSIIFGDNKDIVQQKVTALGGIFEDLGYGYGIVTIDNTKLRDVYSIREIIYIELPKNLYTSSLEPNRASCIPEAWEKYDLTGEGVLLGFIDSGIDFTHPAFKDESGNTRIDCINDLSLKKIYYSNEINEALKSPDPFSIVQQRDFMGHGTHVAGIASAGGSIPLKNYGVAFKGTIAMVKMTGEGLTRFAKSTQLMRGIKFLVERSRTIKKPLVINLSFSTNDGAHDGRSLLEQYIENICRVEQLTFVVAAGNEGDKAHHVGGILLKNQTISFNVAQDETAIVIQIYKNILSDLQIEVLNPAGNSSGLIRVKEGYLDQNIGEEKIALFYTGPKPFSMNGEIVLSILPLKDTIMSGEWKLNITAENVVNGIYDIWLPIAEGLNENTRFLQPTVLNTLGIPATVSAVISVGSYNYKDGALSPFSGRGTIESMKPDLIAPGENIESTTPDNSFSTFSGTSMATPMVAGASALLVEWGIIKKNDLYMYGERLKYYLLKGAKRTRPQEIYPNPSLGYGELCLQNAINIYRTNFRRLKDDNQIGTKTKYKNVYLRFPNEYKKII